MFEFVLSSLRREDNHAPTEVYLGPTQETDFIPALPRKQEQVDDVAKGPSRSLPYLSQLSGAEYTIPAWALVSLAGASNGVHIEQSLAD